MLVLSYFVLFFFFPYIGAGARGWVVDTAGHGGWFHPAGVRLLAKCRVLCGHLTSTCDECCYFNLAYIEELALSVLGVVLVFLSV